MVNCLSHENQKTIPKFLSGIKLFRNVTLQILNLISVSYLIKIYPIWCNVKCSLPFFFFVLFNAVTTDSKLTLHHIWENFYYLTYEDKIWNLEGYIFEKFFTIKMFWDGRSVFRTIEDVPRVHWDETEFRIIIVVGFLPQYMSPVKRICVFEHSVMTNFNWACPVIQRG